MTLNFWVEDSSDSTDYFAILESNLSDERWQMHLMPTGLKRTIAVQKDIPCRVYSDPTTRNPLVVETEQGVFWAMAGNAAVQRIG